MVLLLSDLSARRPHHAVPQCFAATKLWQKRSPKPFKLAARTRLRLANFTQAWLSEPDVPMSSQYPITFEHGGPAELHAETLEWKRAIIVNNLGISCILSIKTLQYNSLND
jgi:hypothetical protein